MYHYRVAATVTAHTAAHSQQRVSSSLPSLTHVASVLSPPPLPTHLPIRTLTYRKPVNQTLKSRPAPRRTKLHDLEDYTAFNNKGKGLTSHLRPMLSGRHTPSIPVDKPINALNELYNLPPVATIQERELQYWNDQDYYRRRDARIHDHIQRLLNMKSLSKRELLILLDQLEYCRFDLSELQKYYLPDITMAHKNDDHMEVQKYKRALRGESSVVEERVSMSSSGGESAEGRAGAEPVVEAVEGEEGEGKDDEASEAADISTVNAMIGKAGSKGVATIDAYAHIDLSRDPVTNKFRKLLFDPKHNNVKQWDYLAPYLIFEPDARHYNHLDGAFAYEDRYIPYDRIKYEIGEHMKAYRLEKIRREVWERTGNDIHPKDSRIKKLLTVTPVKDIGYDHTYPTSRIKRHLANMEWHGIKLPDKYFAPPFDKMKKAKVREQISTLKKREAATMQKAAQQLDKYISNFEGTHMEEEQKGGKEVYRTLLVDEYAENIKRRAAFELLQRKNQMREKQFEKLRLSLASKDEQRSASHLYRLFSYRNRAALKKLYFSTTSTLQRIIVERQVEQQLLSAVKSMDKTWKGWEVAQLESEIVAQTKEVLARYKYLDVYNAAMKSLQDRRAKQAENEVISEEELYEARGRAQVNAREASYITDPEQQKEWELQQREKPDEYLDPAVGQKPWTAEETLPADPDEQFFESKYKKEANLKAQQWKEQVLRDKARLQSEGRISENVRSGRSTNAADDSTSNIIIDVSAPSEQQHQIVQQFLNETNNRVKRREDEIERKGTAAYDNTVAKLEEEYKLEEQEAAEETEEGVDEALKDDDFEQWLNKYKEKDTVDAQTEGKDIAASPQTSGDTRGPGASAGTVAVGADESGRASSQLKGEGEGEAPEDEDEAARKQLSALIEEINKLPQPTKEQLERLTELTKTPADRARDISRKVEDFQYNLDKDRLRIPGKLTALQAKVAQGRVERYEARRAREAKVAKFEQSLKHGDNEAARIEVESDAAELRSEEVNVPLTPYDPAPADPKWVQKLLRWEEKEFHYRTVYPKLLEHEGKILTQLKEMEEYADQFYDDVVIELENMMMNNEISAKEQSEWTPDNIELARKRVARRRFSSHKEYKKWPLKELVGSRKELDYEKWLESREQQFQHKQEQSTQESQQHQKDTTTPSSVTVDATATTVTNFTTPVTATPLANVKTTPSSTKRHPILPPQHTSSASTTTVTINGDQSTTSSDKEQIWSEYSTRVQSEIEKMSKKDRTLYTLPLINPIGPTEYNKLFDKWQQRNALHQSDIDVFAELDPTSEVKLDGGMKAFNMLRQNASKKKLPDLTDKQVVEIARLENRSVEDVLKDPTPIASVTERVVLNPITLKDPHYRSEFLKNLRPPSIADKAARPKKEDAFGEQLKNEWNNKQTAKTQPGSEGDPIEVYGHRVTSGLSVTLQQDLLFPIDDFRLYDPVVTKEVQSERARYNEQVEKRLQIRLKQKQLDFLYLEKRKAEKLYRVKNFLDLDPFGMPQDDERRAFDDKYFLFDEEEYEIKQRIDPLTKHQEPMTYNTSWDPYYKENYPNYFTLHDDTIELLYYLHRNDPVKWTPRALAHKFKLSAERVKTALTIQAIHYRMVENGVSHPLMYKWEEEYAIEDVLNPQYGMIHAPAELPRPAVPDYRWVKEDDLPDVLKEEKATEERWLSKSEKLDQREREFYGRMGPIGVDPPPDFIPTSLDAPKLAPTRHNILFTDVTELSQSRFAMVVRQRTGELRNVNDAEYENVRRREKSKFKFVYINYYQEPEPTEEKIAKDMAEYETLKKQGDELEKMLPMPLRKSSQTPLLTK